MRTASISLAIGCALLAAGYGTMRFAEAHQRAMANGEVQFWAEGVAVATEYDREQLTAALQRWNNNQEDYSKGRFNAYLREQLNQQQDPYAGIADLMTKDSKPNVTTQSLPEPQPKLEKSLVMPGAMWFYTAGVGALSIGAMFIGSGIAAIVQRRPKDGK